MNDERDLVARHVEADPNRPGPGDVRLVGSAVPVWAVIGQLAATGWRIDEVAVDYAIPLVEVKAALAYYRTNGGAIDARLAANRGVPVPTAAGVA